jgi:hypothetical protein
VWLASKGFEQLQERAAFWKPFSWMKRMHYFFFLSFFLLYTIIISIRIFLFVMQILMCFPTLRLPKELSLCIDIGSRWEYHGHPIWNRIKPLNWMNEMYTFLVPKLARQKGLKTIFLGSKIRGFYYLKDHIRVNFWFRVLIPNFELIWWKWKGISKENQRMVGFKTFWSHMSSFLV